MKNGLVWSLALPLSVAFLGAAYYVKSPGVREQVDARTPLARTFLGRFVQGPKVVIVGPAPAPAAEAAKPIAAAPKAPLAAPAAQIPEPSPAAVAPPPPAKLPDAPLDLKAIAADPSLWPKKVALTKAAKFPAVLNGKVVGELLAPVGSEANVKFLKEDKVGVEFNGGGAWLPVAETDLLARVTAMR